MRRHLLAGLRMLVVLTVLLGVVYPLAVTGIRSSRCPSRANGSLVRSDGAVVGSALLGAGVRRAQWFHRRPDAYDPTASGPSNLGPTNPDLIDTVSERRRRAYGGRTTSNRSPIPSTPSPASGSGLDPTSAPAYARLQAPRVAPRGAGAGPGRARPDRSADRRPDFGFLGDPRVNVLLLNLRLRAPSRSSHDHAASSASTSDTRPASARPSRCSVRASSAGARHRVVVGFVETHGRPKTRERAGRLEVVPGARSSTGARRSRRWMSTRSWPERPDRAGRRARPHERPGSRNEKRWQDVEEILEAGHRRHLHRERPAPRVVE